MALSMTEHPTEHRIRQRRLQPRIRPRQAAIRPVPPVPLRLLGAATLLLLLGACERPRADGTIVIGVNRDAGVLLPVLESSALDAELSALLFPGLNSAEWRDGALAYTTEGSALAEGWEFGPDSTTLTYRLRRDAVWSDGAPLTAKDVVFTYELIRRPEVASPFIEFWENLDSVVAIDDHRLTFHFRRPYPGMLFHTGIGILPAHVFESHGADNAALLSHPAVLEPAAHLVVSGPFRVAEWRRDERLVLVPNPRAFAGPPALQRVVFRVIPEETTRLVELRNGNLDLIHPAPLHAAPRLAVEPGLRVETIEDRFYDYVAWNGKSFAPFADPDIRRALSLAIDRRAILSALGLEEYATPAGGPYAPIFRKLADPAIAPDDYLPDSARAILAATGWRDTDSDGLLDRGGRPFRFTLLTQANLERRTSAAEMIQDQFRRIGIDMRIRQVEFNALLEIMFETRDFEAVLLGWMVALEPDYLVGMFTPADHPYNITGYASPRVDSLTALALAARGEEEAAAHWRAAARIISRDRPYAFLWFFDDIVAVRDRIRDTRIDTYGIYQTLHRWSIDR